MAAKDSTKNSKSVTITIPEIHRLIDRMAEKADSIENIGTAELVRDLRLLNKIVRALLKSFGQSDVVSLSDGEGR